MERSQHSPCAISLPKIGQLTIGSGMGVMSKFIKLYHIYDISSDASRIFSASVGC